MLQELKKGLSFYFGKFFGFLIGGIVLIMAGIYSSVVNLSGGITNFEYAVDKMPYFYLILAAVLPLLTHLERKGEMRPWPKKAFAADFLTLGVVLLIPTLVLHLYPILLCQNGEGYLPTALSVIWAFFFLGLVIVSISLLITYKIKNQFVAAAISLVSAALLYFMVPIAGFSDSAISALICKISPFERFHNFTGGIFDWSAILYFLSITGVMLLFGTQGEKKSSFYISLAVMVVLIGANFVVGRFTKGALIMDTTSSRMYTLGEELKAELSKTAPGTRIDWIVTQGSEDASIRTALYVYERHNPSVQFTRLNPASSEAYLTERVVEDIFDNSLLVSGGGKARFISFEELFSYDYSHYAEDKTFDLMYQMEDSLTHALYYVNGSAGDNQNILYVAGGHREAELSKTFRRLMEKDDLELRDIGMLTELPEDASMLLLNAPIDDFTDEEMKSLVNYLERGGNVFAATTMTEKGYLPENISTALSAFGIFTLPGIVVDGEAQLGITFEVLEFEHEVTQPMINAGRSVVLSIAQGMMYLPIEGVTQEPLLTSSDISYIKKDGYYATTLEKEEGDMEGPFALGIAATKTNEDGSEAKLVYVSTGAILDDSVDSQSSGGNQRFVRGALAWLADPEGRWQSLSPVKYNYGRLTSEGEDTSRLGMLMVGGFPLILLAVGAIVALLKHRKEAPAPSEESPEEGGEPETEAESPEESGEPTE